MKPVSIVIVTRNGLAQLKGCLQSVSAHTSHSSFEVVVVDNASTDGTSEHLRSLRSVTLIENDAELGSTKAINRAVAQLPADRDIVLLSNRAEVCQPTWLEQLQNTAYAQPEIGVVGCRLRSEYGILQHVGKNISAQGRVKPQSGPGELDINQFSTDCPVDCVSFSCVYIKREVLQKIGLLDEELHGHFKDQDFCFRAREAGYATVCCGEVAVTHHEDASSISQDSVSEAAFDKRWHNRLTSGRYTRQLGWRSLFEFPSGYAISSKQIALALDGKGVELSYRYLYGPGTCFPILESEASSDETIKAIRGRSLADDGIQVVYGQGDRFEANSGRYKIGFSMLETTRIPCEWVRQANQLDEVWVPSTFNVRTFQDSGVKRPIHVIPLGVDANYFNPRIVGHPIPNVFSFLSIFEWRERKAPELLMRAFNDEFSHKDPVVLICKILNYDRDNQRGASLSSQIAGLRLRRSGGRIVFSLNENIPTYQLGVLYRSADCFVTSTRGEGWGMPIIEAMASGLPVIATNWSAHCDFMRSDNAYPVEVEKLVPAESRSAYYRGSEWAQPSYEHLRRQMRYVFEHQQEARETGLRAAAEVSSKWTWGHSADRIIARLDAIK